MAKALITIILSALAMLAAASLGLAADTLADMGIAVDPALVAYGIDPGEKHPIAGEIYHAEAQPQFIRAQPIGPVVFIGDSIIAFLPAGLLPRNAVNLGIGGATTGMMLANEVPRIPSNASRVVIEGGINDMLNPNLGNNTAANYGAILSRVPTTATVSVVGILPVNQSQLRGNFGQYVDNTKIAATNAQISATCHCTLASVPPLTTVDGIHPTPAGQAVLAKALH